MVTYESLVNYFDSLVDNPFPLTISDIKRTISNIAYEKAVLGCISMQQLEIIRNRYNY